MAEKRRALGKGIGALIPTIEGSERPSDIFFPRSAVTPEPTPQHHAAGPGTEQNPKAVRRAVPDASATTAPSSTTPGAAPGVATEQEAPRSRKVATKTRSKAATSKQGAEPGARQSAATGAAAAGELLPIPGLRMASLKLDDIAANPRQPREVFDEDDLAELAASIREVGLLQPIIVRPQARSAGKYELIMGERRTRAARLAGLEEIPAIVREVEDNQLLRDALLENLHRANLNPLEEASAYQQLLEDFACTHEELAKSIARSRPQISNTLRLLKLPPLVQRRLAAGVISAGHARALLSLPNGGAMERLAQRIVAEGLSVRSTEEIVALGEEPLKPEMRRRALPPANQPALDQLATRLADRFDTRVKVAMGARRGRITIDFATLEDLGRILESMAPGEHLSDS